MNKKLEELAKLIRYYILISTTEAGSGHPSSSLSATDLMTVLFFNNFFEFNVDHPKLASNDRLIFSKGHASPLFYALWAAAGKVSEEELLTLRKFGSPLEGHPTMAFPYTEAPTGSLGQGISVAVGMALNAKYIDKLPYNTYVLLGDSEMAEGSVWEAMEIAAHYKLDNLIGVIDVNRLGQRGETLYGHDVEKYRKKVEAFGWEAIIIDGHNLTEITTAYTQALSTVGKPIMIIAKTLKGKGVSLLENEDNWHGKALPKEELEKSLSEIGKIDRTLRGEIKKPEVISIEDASGNEAEMLSYKKGEAIATRRAYGNALARLYTQFPNMVVLDAEVSNSTYSEIFKNKYPDRFFEMFIAEQNMVGTAIGFANRGKIPFVSTFAAFLTRAFDQIRMSQYADTNIKLCGSHAGVSIGEDGASQMALEDIAMCRAVLNSTVLYPSDAVSTEKLVEQMAFQKGVMYIRTTRANTPVIYDNDETFSIGGCKVLTKTDKDDVTLVAAGITLFEALKAQKELMQEGIHARVIDLYSIKPIDTATLKKAAHETGLVITVEDHYAEGGLGEAVKDALSDTGVKVFSLAVRKMPVSGKPEELLSYEEIDSKAIIKKVKAIL